MTSSTTFVYVTMFLNSSISFCFLLRIHIPLLTVLVCFCMLFIFPNRAFNMLYLTYYFSIRVFNEVISNSQFEVFKIYAISNACSVSSDFSFALLANLANFCWKLYMIYQAKRTWGFMTVWLEVRPLLVVEAIVLSFTSPLFYLVIHRCSF